MVSMEFLILTLGLMPNAYIIVFNRPGLAGAVL